MKNLKDNAMMQEMSLQDMKDVNGGSPWWALYELMCAYAPVIASRLSIKYSHISS